MLVGFGLAVMALPVVAWTAYLAALALLSRAIPVSAVPQPPGTRFDVVVPAHDEERGIGSTVRSLLAVRYPTAMFRVIVVADNCTDATAARAAEAGAVVVERMDAARRGKGYALAYAFERTLAEASADAVVVVDADTTVTPNLLSAFDSRLRGGACAVQAEYCVANPGASWRTRLMHIGFTLFHDVRSRARERVRVSCGLRGNGMAFSVPLLREVPHDAFSVVEDVEYGIRLALAGHRVHYAGEARVFGDMASSEGASRSQRRRWEGGRWLLARRYASRLLIEGIRRRNLTLVDLALDLWVPPITYVALAAMAGAMISAAAVVIGLAPWWTPVPWAATLLGFSIYVARGVWLARVGPRVILDLAWAPVYMMWKVILAVRSPSTRETEWVRTAREGEKP